MWVPIWAPKAPNRLVSWLLQWNGSTRTTFSALKFVDELNAQGSAMDILRPPKSMN